MTDFYRQMGAGTRKLQEQKAGWSLQSRFPVGGGWGLWADDLTGAHGAAPDELVQGSALGEPTLSLSLDLVVGPSLK